ncbi:MAG: hypothetical protein UZ12_BCD005001648 [Bacteroidetes bacterium OLB12]|nr:MAG: hypothetical protein UZ12_BCD005001648 [Bacteroidetes bacterium OLB12]HNR73022.1 hypothetical protein [Cyclobacteriaceae bacterium]HNU41506.1 hypothetical protein [Cyclobacteriaceae bacterium]
MLNTNTLWFEVALVSFITALGSIFLGHFEVGTPRWRRVLKLLFFICITVVISATAGRVWAMSFLGVTLLGVLYIHLVWLPGKGINGWTGEPREKYYELRKWKNPPRY